MVLHYSWYIQYWFGQCLSLPRCCCRNQWKHTSLIFVHIIWWISFVCKHFKQSCFLLSLCLLFDVKLLLIVLEIFCVNREVRFFKQALHEFILLILALFGNISMVDWSYRHFIYPCYLYFIEWRIYWALCLPSFVQMFLVLLFERILHCTTVLYSGERLVIINLQE